MSEGAGPSGRASLPPDWRNEVALPLHEMPRGETFVRIHRTAHPPVFFSPGPGRGPIGRFDSAAGLFGVLYLARSFSGAFAETILRNPRRRLVSWTEIETRSMAVLAANRSLRLVGMHGSGLQRLGVDNAVTTGPCAPAGCWADALFRHPDRPDGIEYASRHDPGEFCVAIFRRDDVEIEIVSESVGLADIAAEVAALLRRYGKGLEAAG